MSRFFYFIKHKIILVILSKRTTSVILSKRTTSVILSKQRKTSILFFILTYLYISKKI